MRRQPSKIFKTLEIPHAVVQDNKILNGDRGKNGLNREDANGREHRKEYFFTQMNANKNIFIILPTANF